MAKIQSSRPPCDPDTQHVTVVVRVSVLAIVKELMDELDDYVSSVQNTEFKHAPDNNCDSQTTRAFCGYITFSRSKRPHLNFVVKLVVLTVETFSYTFQGRDPRFRIPPVFKK